MPISPRHFELPSGQNSAMPGYNSTLWIDQHRVREPKFPDTPGDFGDLSLRMGPRVARVGDQSADSPPFYGHVLARGRARRRCWSGSVNLVSGVRPDRRFAAVSWSRQRGKMLATWSWAERKR